MRKKVVHLRLVFFFLLIFLMPVFVTQDSVNSEQVYQGPLNSTALVQLENIGIEQDSKMFDVAENAWLIAKPDSDFTLRDVRLEYDDVTGCESYSIEWMSSKHDLLMVRLEETSNALLYYLNSKLFIHNVECNSLSITEDLAISSALDFVDIYCELPEDAVLVGASKGQNTWVVEWHHIVKNIPVYDDYVRVQLDLRRGVVASFSIKWSDVNVEGESLLCGYDGVHQEPFAQSKPDRTAQMEWLVKNEEDSNEVLLTWKTNTDDGMFWVDVESGNVLEEDLYLYPNDASSLHAVFDDPSHTGPGWDTANHVYDILDDHFTYANLRVDPTTKNGWIGPSVCKAFFSVSHGNKDSTKNWIQVTSTVKVYPSDITYYGSRKLVYLLACYSGYIASTQANSIGWQFVWNGKQFEEGYLNAFVGFTNLVNQIRGCGFTEKFWNRLDSGYNVGAAKSYASGYYSDIGNICVIYGCTSVTL